MSHWYDRYLTFYGHPFSEVPQTVVENASANLQILQSADPLVSVVVIAYNESTRLPACLWSLSQLKSKYPLEILGVS